MAAFMSRFVAFALILGLAAMPAAASEWKEQVLGKADAPVTIIEYASLTCGHCATFHTETLPKVKENWIETGKAKLIYRDFPLDGLAFGAAMVARCAPDGRYFPLLSALFETQGSWTRGSDPASELKKLAKLSGISESEFNACLADKELVDKIREVQAEGQAKYGINSTPTFIIDGVKVEGAVDYGRFEALLNDALAKSRKE